MKPHFFHIEALDEIDAAVATTKASSLASYRFFTMKNFNYVIFFTDETDCLYVAAVAPGRQRPDYWKHRRRNGA